MELKLRSKSKKVTPYRQLVDQAVAVTEKLNALTERNAQKLTAKALLRETLAVAQIPIERISKLREAIESRTPGLEHSRAAMRRMVQFLRSPNWTRAPQSPRHLNFLNVLMTETSNAELLLRQSSSVELFGVAIQIAGEKHPECFGTCDDSAQHDERVADLKERQASLFDQLAKTMPAEEIDVGDVDSDGRARITFAATDGNVPIAPIDNAGERLVGYLLGQRQRQSR